MEKEKNILEEIKKELKKPIVNPSENSISLLDLRSRANDEFGRLRHLTQTLDLLQEINLSHRKGKIVRVKPHFRDIRFMTDKDMEASAIELMCEDPDKNVFITRSFGDKDFRIMGSFDVPKYLMHAKRSITSAFDTLEYYTKTYETSIRDGGSPFLVEEVSQGTLSEKVWVDNFGFVRSNIKVPAMQKKSPKIENTLIASEYELLKRTEVSLNDLSIGGQILFDKTKEHNKEFVKRI